MAKYNGTKGKTAPPLLPHLGRKDTIKQKQTDNNRNQQVES